MPNAVEIHPGIPNCVHGAAGLQGRRTRPTSSTTLRSSAEGSFYSQHEPHLTIEPDTLQGYWGTDGMLTLQCKSHNFGEAREALSSACGIPKENLRMTMNTSGAAFGYSVCPNTFALMVTAVQNLDMPCTLTLSYDEFNHTTGKRMATFSNGRIACDEEGKIIAAEYDVALDHGAYGFVPIFLNLTSLGFHGYNIPNFKALGRGGSSNHNFNTSYRGFGVAPDLHHHRGAHRHVRGEGRHRPLGVPLQERGAAGRPHHQQPAVPAVSLSQAAGDGQAHLRQVQGRGRSGAGRGPARGRGAEHGRLRGHHRACSTSREVALELNPDGTITHYNTWEDLGQGGDIGTLTHTVKALEPLGIKPSQVKLVMNDSKTCPDTGLAAASRSHYVAGHATIDAADKLMDAMRKDDGTYRTYDEMVAARHPHQVRRPSRPVQHGPRPGPRSQHRPGQPGAGVHVLRERGSGGSGRRHRQDPDAALRLGGRRGRGRQHAVGGRPGLRRPVARHRLRPQRELRRPGQARQHDRLRRAADRCDPRRYRTWSSSRLRAALGPHGSCGCSEVFQSCNHMAVINGINDACGVRVYALPATPDKVKAGWEAKQRGEDLTPPKYFLGSDFEEELEWIKANPV